MVRVLLNAGADINIRDGYGSTLLAKATRYYAKPEVIELLLTAGAVVSKQDLASAAQESPPEVFRLLLDAAKNLELQGDAGGKVLMSATMNRNIEILETLLTMGVNVNFQDENGQTPLMLAAQNRNPNATRILLTAGADANARDKEGKTPLMESAYFSASSSAVELLLIAGADVNARDQSGYTSLTYASNSDVLRVLVAAGADVNVKDWEGVTPLMNAVQHRDFGLVTMLLDAGADADARDMDGWTALTYAQRYWSDERAIEILRIAGPIAAAQMDFFILLEKGSVEEIQANIAAGADASALDEYGNTALIRAAYTNERPEVIQMLLDMGADVNETNVLQGTYTARTAYSANGITPLIAAAHSNLNPEVVRLLVNAGANIEEVRGSGETPLMEAISNNPNPEVALALLDLGANANNGISDVVSHRLTTLLLVAIERYRDEPKVIQALLNAGAEINIQAPYTPTPLGVAVRKGNLELIKMLLEAGADVNAWDGDGQTPLMIAESSNVDPEILQSLREANPYSTTLRLTREEFYSLVATGSANDVKAAVLAGANVNATDEYSETPLMRAVAKNEQAEVVQVLLEAGADVHDMIWIAGSWTPLMFAAQSNKNPAIIKLLLEAGAEVNLDDLDGLTPLMLAAKSNENPQVVLALLDAGADGKLRDKAGKTAFDYAKDNPALRGTDAYLRLEESQN